MSDEELDVLNPDRQVSIDGELITCQEYRFFDGLEVEQLAKELVDDMSATLTGDEFKMSALQAVWGKHRDLIVQLVAMSCGRDYAWVKGLDDQAGQALLWAWWGANRGFFTRRFMRDVMLERTLKTALKKVAETVDGAESSPTSAPAAPRSTN